MHDDIIFRASVEVCTVAIMASIGAIFMAASIWGCQHIWRIIWRKRYVFLCMANRVEDRHVNAFVITEDESYAQFLCQKTGGVYTPLEVRK